MLEATERAQGSKRCECEEQENESARELNHGPKSSEVLKDGPASSPAI